MAKKRSYRKRKGFTIPLAVVGGLVPTGLDVFHATQDYGWMAGLDHVSLCTTGITSKPDGSVEWHPGYAAKKLWLPLGAGIVVHMLASKLGVNRMLARIGIPVLRV
jgi:hypothetical protein